MTFQDNVRATFDVRRFAKRASILTLAATFFLSIAIGRQSDPVLAYGLFLVAIGISALIFESTANRDVLNHPSLRIAAVFRPLAFTVPVTLAVYILVYVFVQFPVSGGTAQEKLYPAFFAGVLVGFVEEFARFVWLQILPWSVLTANLLWVFLHPQVAIVLSGQTPNWVFAVFAFVFGFAMTFVMWLYESRLPGRWNESFGPVAAMVFHGGYNILVVVWTLEIGGVRFGVM